MPSLDSPDILDSPDSLDLNKAIKVPSHIACYWFLLSLVFYSLMQGTQPPPPLLFSWGLSFGARDLSLLPNISAKSIFYNLCSPLCPCWKISN